MTALPPHKERLRISLAGHRPSGIRLILLMYYKIMFILTVCLWPKAYPPSLSSPLTVWTVREAKADGSCDAFLRYSVGDCPIWFLKNLDR